MPTNDLKWTARLAHLAEYLPARGRLTGGLTQGLMSTAAALIAYLPTRPLGLQEGFWGSITAIAVVQAELSATRTSALDQFAGAIIGGVISALILTVAGQSLFAYGVGVTSSMLVCWLCNRSSAARLAGSTATIILLVPHKGSATMMMLSRIAEVGWGVAVGVAVVWIVNRVEKAVSGRGLGAAG
jgi:uncharacterized membrane protein YgaE (UPF0421/DUF939 family)